MLRGLVAVCVILAGDASAHADALFAPWQDETKQIEIQIAQNGWQIVRRETGTPLELEAAPQPTERPRSALCTLSHDWGMGEPWVSRVSANERMRREAQTLRQLYESNHEFNLERFEVSDVDGVAVVDVYGGIGTLHGLTRRFYLSRNGEITHYTLSCSAERSDVARVATAIRIARSLRVTEEAASQ